MCKKLKQGLTLENVMWVDRNAARPYVTIGLRNMISNMAYL